MLESQSSTGKTLTEILGISEVLLKQDNDNSQDRKKSFFHALDLTNLEEIALKYHMVMVEVHRAEPQASAVYHHKSGASVKVDNRNPYDSIRIIGEEKAVQTAQTSVEDFAASNNFKLIQIPEEEKWKYRN